jgi:hypothetical protein
MWRRVGLVETDVSKERVASIFRAEEITQAKKNLINRLTYPRSRYFFYPEDGGSTFLRNVGFYKTHT